MAPTRGVSCVNIITCARSCPESVCVCVFRFSGEQKEKRKVEGSKRKNPKDASLARCVGLSETRTTSADIVEIDLLLGCESGHHTNL